MSNEQEPRLELAIAHVLLIDIVGYSKFLVHEQIELLQDLNQIVRRTERFRTAEASDQLFRLPTGDGMALVFFSNAEAPLECALEIGRAAAVSPKLQLRMGAHSGPVKGVADVNDRVNFAGAGINIAQRVLDCGDAGHILLSSRIAEDLLSYERWNSHLYDLGQCEVKHGVRLHLFNLCKDGAGNPALPEKVRQPQQGVPSEKRRWRARKIQAGTLLAAALLAGGLGLSRWIFSRPSSPTRAKSIAVLPFSNLTEEKTDAYFVEGVQEDIRTDLSRVADLKVISRTSVMQYKPDLPRNLREISAALGVSYVLEGDVQRSGRRVLVHAQLIDVQTDAHVWANRYDRELADVFAIQSEIAQEIVSQLEATLSPKEKAALQDRPTSDMAAYDLYIRAKASMEFSDYSAHGKEDLTEAIDFLTQAIARDPGFFLAYYELADAQDLFFQRFEHTTARLAAAARAIEAMQRLRPDAGETHLAIARHRYWGYLDYAGARTELQLAQAALPNHPLPPLLTGYIDRRQGNWESALHQLWRAWELDPRNDFILRQVALADLSLRRFPEMAGALDRAIQIAPDNVAIRLERAAVDLDWRGETKPLHDAIAAIVTADPRAAAVVAPEWFYLAQCERDAPSAQRAVELLGADGCSREAVPFPRSWCEGEAAQLSGDKEAARRLYEKAAGESEEAIRNQPHYAGVICANAIIQAALGNKGEAIRLGREAVAMVPITKDAVDGPLLRADLAAIYARTGETDQALELLREVTKVPSYLSFGNLRLDPSWDPLRGDPRFEKIVASLAPR